MVFFFVGCVMGVLEEGEFMEEFGLLEGFFSDFLILVGYLSIFNLSVDDEQKFVNVGKSDDG